MNDLPNELLVRIFDYLDFKSKLRAELVCKRWQQLIGFTFNNKSSLLIEDIESRSHKRYGDYKPYKLKANNKFCAISLTQMISTYDSEEIYRTVIANIISKFNNLKVLYICLIRCELKSNILKLIYESCPRDLIQLSVICDDKRITISEEEALSTCMAYPNLKVFQFESFYLLIREETIALLLRHLPELEVIILMSLLSNSEDRIEIEDYNGWAFERMNPNIKAIKIPGFVLNEYGLQLLAQKGGKRLIDLTFFDLLHMTTMSLIADNFRSLTNLNCSSFDQSVSLFDSNIFFSHISRLNRLEKLHLLIDNENPMIGYYEIRSLRNCHELRTLRIESTPLTNDCIEAVQRFLPNLLKLELTYVRFFTTTDDCLHPILRMKRLKSLKIASMPELTDHTFINLMTGSNQLYNIDVSRSEDITVESMAACIGVANQRPHELFKCVFEGSLKKQFNPLCLPLPNNLQIKYLYIRKL